MYHIQNLEESMLKESVISLSNLTYYRSLNNNPHSKYHTDIKSGSVFWAEN